MKFNTELTEDNRDAVNSGWDKVCDTSSELLTSKVVERVSVGVICSCSVLESGVTSGTEDVAF